MFALIAAVVWFAAAFGWHLGGLDLLLFGLGFLGLHLAFGWGLTRTPWRR